VAVRGLATGCGTSTVARALAAVLARDDPGDAAVLVGAVPHGGPRLAAGAAVRLARSLAEAGCQEARAAGRLCVVGQDEPLSSLVAARRCPVVFDVDHSAPPGDGLGLAEHVVLVASPAVANSLAAAVASSLRGAGHSVDVVLNRFEDPGPALDELPDAVAVGESRLSAQVALACRGPRGPFAAPIAELAERCRARAAP
jgi:hypothetical protein